MTEGFRSSPPPTPGFPTGTTGSPQHRQEVTDTVQRIMGDDIAPPAVLPTAAAHRAPTASDESSTAEVAKDQAGQVADTAKQAGAQVAGTVKEQAGQVTAEAGKQAKQLLAEAQSQVTEQAGATQQRVAEGLHALADELTGMAKNSEQDGPATDLARQAADKAHQAASWLADRDPGALLDEVRSFARRKPGAYLAIALGAGVLAGRLTRGLTAPSEDDTPARPAIPGPAVPTQFDGTEPVGIGTGVPAPAFGTGYQVDPAPTAGFGGTTGPVGDTWGDVPR